MVHVYLILAHRAPEQLARLVDRLDGEGVRFLIHVDGRSPPPVHQRARQLLDRGSRLRFLRSQPTPWAGTGHMTATLAGMGQALRAWPELDYLSLMTGQDYPLRPGEQIAQRLEQSRGAAYLEHFPLPRRPGDVHKGTTDVTGWTEGGYDRIFPRRTVGLGRRRRTIPFQRRLPGDLELFGGSGYWTLPAECVALVRRTLWRRPGILRFFRHVHIPHEMFFHTVLANSPLAERLVNDDLRYIDWSTGGAHPKLLTTADLPALSCSEMLFARKFDMESDPAVLDQIDARLLRRGPTP